jgi:hypothetical protein
MEMGSVFGYLYGAIRGSPGAHQVDPVGAEALGQLDEAMKQRRAASVADGGSGSSRTLRIISQRYVPGDRLTCTASPRLRSAFR